MRDRPFIMSDLDGVLRHGKSIWMLEAGANRQDIQMFLKDNAKINQLFLPLRGSVDNFPLQEMLFGIKRKPVFRL